MLDVGAGSGVLAIAAALLGYAPVLALDNDRESVTAIGENAAVNGVDIQARLFDLRVEPLPSLVGFGEREGGAPAMCPASGGSERPAGAAGRGLGEPIVLANLLRPLLLELSRSIERPPPHLIASGLLREEAEEVGDRIRRARRHAGATAAGDGRVGGVVADERVSNRREQLV